MNISKGNRIGSPRAWGDGGSYGIGDGNGNIGDYVGMPFCSRWGDGISGNCAGSGTGKTPYAPFEGATGMVYSHTFEGATIMSRIRLWT